MLQKILKRGLSGTSAATNPPLVNLKQLPYEIGALEPVISGHQMEFHYGKHHRTYVNNLNKLQNDAAEALATGRIANYVKLSSAIKFNGGGHLNHEFFWDSLKPIKAGGGVLPDEKSELRTLIEKEWGTMNNFMVDFNNGTAALQGSGWGWLIYNTHAGILEFRTTVNQDMPSDLGHGHEPLLTIDIWEHAYYLDYQNARPNYLSKIWQIVDWQKVEERLAAVKAKAK